MYQIIDSCYEQNLGLAKSPPDAEIVSMILNGDRQLDEWRYQTVPALQLRISHAPLSSQDIEQIEVKDKTVARFNMVLSLRFHNLRILNHRPILEKFLDSARAIQGVEAGMMHQVYISSIETCVDSAINIVAIVHNVVLATGWRRDLLGAWNYSLFYTLLVCSKAPAMESAHSPTPWKFLDNATVYLNMAIEALQNLDRGNRVVQRITDYLSHLAVALSGLLPINIESNLNLGSITRYDPSGAASHTSQTQQVQGGTSYQTLAQQPEIFPSDTDLSEFMLDADLDFLFRQFDADNMDPRPSSLHPGAAWTHNGT
ncbi:hypothetical protein LTR67_009634 [Exophiala xenobiotica]